MTDIASAAQELAAAREHGKPCPPLRGRLLPEGDVESAYRVQQLQVREWLAAGQRRVGAKIGLTSRAVQENLGVYEPDFGVLTDTMAAPDGAEVAIDRLLQPRVEAEVAFVLSADLPDDRVTTVDLLRAVDHLLPAIEIVDSRVAGWDISIVDTVADNASSGLFVLGTTPRRIADVDLRLCGMVLEHAGEPVSVGAGAACLGNPLHALAWLAGTMARAGDPLRAGDVVLSGALGPMVPVTPGAAYEARISGLGSVRTCFSREAS
ncbi:2-keto-4-pentenoate hydratase [Micromonospora zingiberis]|uniref:2-keto-4-pentenoate hydratase n=1 Tax=Micromonospora zingiberis TaxID=2053011 RepID=A0A4R0GHL1_9ACTN|nr:fumarylacetoacetate hydrolase family protein [Micromonospora zingiberis]TCB95852.1 2-keto-4-pentenoate hydratase [Micromonospora zingiberis]